MDSSLQVKPANSLASISLMPSNIRFANQNSDEQVVLFIRQHKVILFGYFFRFLINLIIPIGVFFLFQWLGSFDVFKNSRIDIKGVYIFAAFLVWYLWSFTSFFSDFLFWFYNAYIITSQRLIDLDFIGVTKNSVKELALSNIEDVVDTRNGVLQTIFDMGRVDISTASESTKFFLNNVPKASKVRDFIMDMALYNGNKAR